MECLMSKNVTFTKQAWEQYLEWQMLDKKIVIKINELIKDILRNGLAEGIGKPEPLKYRKAWSRRITQEHRIVYNLDVNDNLIILAVKGHYQD